MVEINLLPWRVYLRASKQQKLKKLFLGNVILIALLFGAYHFSVTNHPHSALPVSSPVKPSLRVNFKFVGYLQRNTIFWALVVLPTGETIDVHPGSLIGKKIRVVSVDENKMIVEYAAHRLMINYNNLS